MRTFLCPSGLRQSASPLGRYQRGFSASPSVFERFTCGRFTDFSCLLLRETATLPQPRRTRQGKSPMGDVTSYVSDGLRGLGEKPAGGPSWKIASPSPSPAPSRESEGPKRRGGAGVARRSRSPRDERRCIPSYISRAVHRVRRKEVNLGNNALAK